MEAFHSNFPYDPIHMLAADPPMTGSSSLTGRLFEDDMRNSSATESPKLPVGITKNEKWFSDPCPIQC